MKSIVITGSTRGIGYGLADAFLARECAVTVSGRTASSTEKAVEELSAKYPSERILGQPCDVSHMSEVEALWKAALGRFGQVDIWINNAGVGHPRVSFWDHSAEEIEGVVAVNLIGTMNACRVALKGMREQGFGALYNMEGLGSDGQKAMGMTLYGTTKYGVRYLTEALAEEVKGTTLIVGALSPGIVITDPFVRPSDEYSSEWEKAKRILNILADRVDTVAPWLVEKMLTNYKSGVRIAWLTPRKALWRFITAPFRRRNLVQ